MEQGGVAADQIEIVSLWLQLSPAFGTLWAYCSLRGVVPIECWSWTNFREPKEMFWCDLRIYALTVANGRAADAMIDTRSEQPRPRSWANKEYYSKLAENFKTFGRRNTTPENRRSIMRYRSTESRSVAAFVPIWRNLCICRICPNLKESLHVPHLSQFEGISACAAFVPIWRNFCMCRICPNLKESLTGAQVHGFNRSIL